MLTRDIFAVSTVEVVDYRMDHGLLRLVDGWLPAPVADDAYEKLLGELTWQEETLRMFGRLVRVPRRVAWYGDEGAVYRYSGIDHQPLPWTPTLSVLKQTVEAYCGWPFNSVLANHYRNGLDYMGWHSDDEPELGDEPGIASLSLGAERRFLVRHRHSGETHTLRLGNGSLLLMGGVLQKHYRHCLPKTRIPVSGRINLTFRQIYPNKKAGGV